MNPTNFDGSNLVLGPPVGETEDQVGSLFARRTIFDGHAVVVSCFCPSAAELAEINRTGRVWLVVRGRTMPPVILAGFNPAEWMRETDGTEAQP